MMKFMAIFHTQVKDDNGRRLKIEYGPFTAENEFAAENTARHAIEKIYPNARLESLKTYNGNRKED